MLAKRVIPCLDVHDGQVTRGVQFGVAEQGGLRKVGDPVELALRYNEQGADEMVFFDITATAHGRGTMVDVIERTASQCFMPLTVGGGIKSVDDMYTMLRAGADKTSINSSALANPELIRQGHLFILQTPLFRVRNKKVTRYCYTEGEKRAALDELGKSAEITRFKGLGEISPDEFKEFIGPDMRLEQVHLDPHAPVRELLTFYMGKNTPDRQGFIIDNLRVEQDIIADEPPAGEPSAAREAAA